MIRKKFLAIIPARAGSVRLKNKNLLKFNNKPLISHTILEALKVKELDEIIVSTDSEKILKIAKKNGAKVPFLRSKYLSKSNTPSHLVLLHAINFFEKKKIKFDNIILLQPTSPLRKDFHIKEALKFFNKKKAHCVISVCENDHPVEWINYIDKSLSLNNFIKKKDIDLNSTVLKKSFKLNGAIYIIKTSELIKKQTLFLNKKIFAYIMDRKYSVDIDTMMDFRYAEFLSSYNKLK